MTDDTPDDRQRALDMVAQGFYGARVLVIGDAMLDRYVRGDVGRISPEAPVPILRITRRDSVAGGAANVAANLSALGCRVALVAACGADAGQQELLARLQESHIDVAGVVAVPGYPTIEKTRILGGHQHMLRLDEERPAALDAAAREPLVRAALAALTTADAVVLSDYAKGVLGGDLAPRVIAAARARGIPVLVDPKGVDWSRYHGATTITPNTSELVAVTGVPADNAVGLLTAGAELVAKLGLTYLTFTRGELGIAVIGLGQPLLIPAVAREVFDVSGAGDTVIALLAACAAASVVKGTAGAVSVQDATRLANRAAGIVVGKLGTVPIRQHELLEDLQREYRTDGIIAAATSLDIAQERVRAWQRRGESVVFTNGCFDVFHAGHVVALESARRHGQRLVVGLNDDASVTRLKGPARPIHTLADRAAVLAALRCVDLVVPFSGDTPLDVICALRPNVLVKGADYRKEAVVGGREVESWGGRVELVPLLPGRSTTAILAAGGGPAGSSPALPTDSGAKHSAP